MTISIDAIGCMFGITQNIKSIIDVVMIIADSSPFSQANHILIYLIQTVFIGCGAQNLIEALRELIEALRELNEALRALNEALRALIEALRELIAVLKN